MALPKPQEDGYIQKFKNFFGNSEEKVKIPSHALSQEESLFIFLHDQRNDLLSLEFQTIKGASFTKFVTNVYQVYQQLHSQKIMYMYRHTCSTEEWVSTSLAQVINYG